MRQLSSRKLPIMCGVVLSSVEVELLKYVQEELLNEELCAVIEDASLIKSHH